MIYFLFLLLSFCILLIAVMDVKDKMIKELRTQVDKFQEDFVALKYNYNEEKQSNLKLSQRFERILADKVKLIAERKNLKDRMTNLQRELETLRQVQKKLRPIAVQKPWKKLKKRAKLKRKANYKDVLDQSVRCITECKRAKMTLTLGDKEINLKWTEQEMLNHRANLNVSLPDECSSEDISDGNDEENHGSNMNLQTQPNVYDVFDANCKFSKRHKRTMITVMDNHRVSHKAYHAIRRAGKGNLPSLNLIKKEKTKMSKEIPFKTSDEV